MKDQAYIMEGDEEMIRLDVKTRGGVVREQAVWAGLKPGMRVADLGCGSGKTTFNLHSISKSDTVGIDIAPQRVTYANENYSSTGARFMCRDIRNAMDDLGTFDFIWVRFVLEYYKHKSLDIVRNISRILKPGGILLLQDLDHNCLNHYGMSPTMETALSGVMKTLEEKAGFDPFVGKKLYAFLYDLGYEKIRMNMTPHHLIYGELNEADAFNWTKKVEVAARNSGYDFKEYDNGFDGFLAEFNSFFRDPRRFTYTALIACRGIKKQEN